MRIWSWFAFGTLTLVMLLGGVMLLRSRSLQPARSPYEGRATLAQLQELPETNLYYPDSEIVVCLERQDLGPFAGRNPSYAGYDLAANASQDEILVFYAQELQRRGWQPLGGVYAARSTSEQIARSWRKGDRIFRFVVREKDDPLGPPADIAVRFPTVYSIKVRNLNSDEQRQP